MTTQLVHVRINDAATGQPTAVRIRFADRTGRYYPPLGRPAEFSADRSQCSDGSVVVENKAYAYIDGTCEVRLPAGPIEIEVCKGFEYVPIRHVWERKEGQIALRLALSRQFNLEPDGWFSGDTHVLGSSPHDAALEAAGEGIRIVNLLSEQVGRGPVAAFPNLVAFSGQQPALVAADCQVIVNTLNDGHELGRLVLLNCHRPVFPLALGEEGFESYTVTDWCQQCHRKNGLVVWPNFAGPTGQLDADLIVGGIDAVEWTFPEFGLEHWYRLLNLGFRVPLVGGSGKTGAGTVIGAVRTYAQIPEEHEVHYGAWIDAVRAGRCFASRGPVLRFLVNGHGPGSRLTLAGQANTVEIQIDVESVFDFERVELVRDGEVIDVGSARSELRCSVSNRVRLEESCWLAARCMGINGELLAHTSPVYVLTDRPRTIFPQLAEPIFDHFRRMSAWIDAHAADSRQREQLHGLFAEAQRRLKGEPQINADERGSEHQR